MIPAGPTRGIDLRTAHCLPPTTDSLVFGSTVTTVRLYLIVKISRAGIQQCLQWRGFRLISDQFSDSDLTSFNFKTGYFFASDGNVQAIRVDSKPGEKSFVGGPLADRFSTGVLGYRFLACVQNDPATTIDSSDCDGTSDGSSPRHSRQKTELRPMKITSPATPKPSRRLGFGQAIQVTFFLAIAATIGSGQQPTVAPNVEQPSAAPRLGGGVVQAGSVSQTGISADKAGIFAQNVEKKGPNGHFGTAGELLGFSSTDASGSQTITLVHSGKSWMAVYHIDRAGTIRLVSSRPIDADFSLLLNATSPLPDEIREMGKSR